MAFSTDHVGVEKDAFPAHGREMPDNIVEPGFPSHADDLRFHARESWLPTLNMMRPRRNPLLIGKWDMPLDKLNLMMR
jgi:hypothetical protein